MRKKLTLGYSTLASRVGNITPPKPNSAWEILIIIQNPQQVAWKGKGLGVVLREDVRVTELTSTGVAKSRNKAIELSTAEYLIFSDDDIVFDPEALQTAIDFLDVNRQYDMLLGAAVDQNGEARKDYPKQIVPLTKFNSAKAATYEMLVRVDAIRKLGIRFDEKFGAGAKNYLGDEFIFIADLLDAGGKGVFHPVVLATHPTVSSGSGWGTDRDFNARLAIFNRVFGEKALLIRLGFAIRRRKQLGLLGVLRFALGKPTG